MKGRDEFPQEIYKTLEMLFILISIVLIANNSCLSMSRTHANQNSQDIKTKRFLIREEKATGNFRPILPFSGNKQIKMYLVYKKR